VVSLTLAPLESLSFRKNKFVEGNGAEGSIRQRRRWDPRKDTGKGEQLFPTPLLPHMWTLFAVTF
jgi:hypothetical protein